MSPILSFGVIAVLLAVFTQFGRRLSASHAIIWWPISVFMAVSIISPNSLGPLTHFLGISLVSNFFLGAMIVFLFIQLLVTTATVDASHRRLKSIVSSLTASGFNPVEITSSSTRRALVVLPAYNEERSILAVLGQLKALPAPMGWHIDFCFIDDGSDDGTLDLLATHAPGQYLRHFANLGVSGVLLTGFKIGQKFMYDAVIQCDADGQHPVEAIPRLIVEAEKLGADLLIASRFLRSGSPNTLESTTWARRFGAIIISAALLIFGRKVIITDPTSGFRFFSRRVLPFLIKNIPDEYPEPEIVAALALKKYKIAEISVRIKAREFGVSSISKMASLRYMVKVLSALLGLRFRSLMYFADR